MVRLSELRVGERGIVRQVGGQPEVCQRLRAMGFVAGTEVTVRRCAPFGDPVAYELLGYCLSLRREEAALVLVDRLPTMDLVAAPAGVRLRIIEIAGGWGMRRRLAAMGIVENALVVKTGATGRRAVEIELGGRRLGIGWGVAERVTVVPNEGSGS